MESGLLVADDDEGEDESEVEDGDKGEEDDSGGAAAEVASAPDEPVDFCNRDRITWYG